MAEQAPLPRPGEASGACFFEASMTARTYQYARLRETPRSAIRVVRVRDELLEAGEIDALAERMREKVEARGHVQCGSELAADRARIRTGGRTPKTIYRKRINFLIRLVQQEEAPLFLSPHIRPRSKSVDSERATALE